MISEELRIPVTSEIDIVTARQQGRALAARIGFSSSSQALIATAISELARNIVSYAGTGEIILSNVFSQGVGGIVVIARDNGPGIENIELAMQDGYSTSKSLGLGLPGAKRLMDEFEILSQPGHGTTITIKKWNR
jgi:serine/threonine-protein kinase RsbT